MWFSASDVVPFTQARANLSELADQAKASTEKLITKNGESYVALVDANLLDHCAPLLDYSEANDAEAASR